MGHNSIVDELVERYGEELIEQFLKEQYNENGIRYIEDINQLDDYQLIIFISNLKEYKKGTSSDGKEFDIDKFVEELFV